MMEFILRAVTLLCFTSFTSRFALGSIQHLPRQAGGGDIDFTDFPVCANTCLVRYRSLGCSTPITKDCYCGKPNPLECAWKNDLNVDEGCWNRTESWYATQCPSVKAVDVASIPSCALECFENTKTNLCLKYTKNCVCSNGKPSCSGTASTCNSTDLAAYDSWYAGECLYNQTSTTATSAPLTSTTSTTINTRTSTTTTSTATGEPTESGSSSISTGAIVGASIGGVAGVIIIGAIAFFAYRRRQSKNVPQTNITHPPPVDYTEYTSVRPVSELMGSTVVPDVRPVEVPTTPHIQAPIYEK